MMRFALAAVRVGVSVTPGHRQAVVVLPAPAPLGLGRAFADQCPERRPPEERSADAGRSGARWRRDERGGYQRHLAGPSR